MSISPLAALIAQKIQQIMLQNPITLTHISTNSKLNIMPIKNLIFITSILLFTLFHSCDKNDQTTIELNTQGHPRILLTKGEEQTIKTLIEEDETWKKMHFAILQECNNILGKSLLQRKMIGRRLLSTSRECLRRVFFLAYGYRMTGDERFLQKAEKEMLAVSNFSDWNPSHFLDVAEMTMGLAIGYDWLYAQLSEDSRKTIREAIAKKGLEPSYNSDYNWFLRATHNWNQVCNAGMTYGALAIQEDYPLLAEETINRAFESIPLAMEDYQPDGAYPEGYGYWGYGTSFNIMFLSAVEKALETDKGLSETPGFLKTSAFLEHMLTPSGVCYNWGDCGARGSLKPAMFWFAERNNDPSLLWSEKKFLEIEDYSKFRGDRLLPAIMIWGKNIPLNQIHEPSSKVWTGQGKNPIFLARTSWTDPNAIYIGFKAGAPSVNHGHMDIGSFIMEADGVRWSADLGSQNYESLESKGMKIFGKTQDAERWTIFRMNTYSHATLIIDDEQQRVDGYAKIDRHSDAADFPFAISDISTVYNGQLNKAIRGIGIKDEQYVVIRDELETLNKPTKVRWNMLTPANVELVDKGAILTKDGKKLFLKIQGLDNLMMKTWSTAPTNDYDAPNPGTIMVGFECDLTANVSQAFEVLLVPENADGIADFLGKSLDEW